MPNAASAALYDAPEMKKLIRLLTEATRPVRQNGKNAAVVYVPPASSDDAESNYNHFIFGQRGSGKSSLMRSLQAAQLDIGRAGIWIDQEVFSNLRFPDVLASCVLDVSDGLLASIRAQPSSTTASALQRFTSWLLRRPKDDLESRLERMSANLRRLKFAALDEEVTWTHKTATGSEAEALGTIAVGGAGAKAAVRSQKSAESTASQTLVMNKSEYLERALHDFRKVIFDASDTLGGGFIFVDDLYFIARADQPKVLGYLNRLVKDSGLYLKIGSIRFSTNTYVPGDPPVGMQEGHDAHDIALDRQFFAYARSKSFLEAILDQLCQRESVDYRALYTDGALDRLVLASGGVPRDYLRLVRISIETAQNRPISTKAGSHRITVEDVNAAAGKIAPSKLEDLGKDSPDEADALHARVIDLTNFCRDRKSGFFLVDIADRSAMRDMDALQHLRLAHLLFQNETIPERQSQRFNVYLLDIAQLSYQRATQGVDFDGWKNRTRRRNRRLVYSSTWAAPSTSPGNRATRSDGRAQQVQGSLFERD